MSTVVKVDSVERPILYLGLSYTLNRIVHIVSHYYPEMIIQYNRNDLFLR